MDRLSSSEGASTSRSGESTSTSTSTKSGFVWLNGMVRMASSAKQARDFFKAWSSSSSSSDGGGSNDLAAGLPGPPSCLSLEAAEKLIPGVACPEWVRLQQQGQQQGQQQEGQPPSAAQPPPTASSAAPPPSGSNRQRKREAARGSPSDQELARGCVALSIPGGLVVDVTRYLGLLWRATQV